MSPVDPSLLQIARNRFSDLDHVPVGLAVVDSALVVLFWNSMLEGWTKIDRSRALGRTLAELNPRWTHPHYSCRLSHLFQGGPPVVFSPLLHPDVIPGNSGRAYDVKATAVPDGQGKYWAFLSVEDITVLSRRIEELRTLHQRQERMMREVHHRVKNNLNLISGLITLQKNQPGIEGALPALKDLQSRIAAISEIHDLLYQSSSLTLDHSAGYLSSLASLIDQNLSLSAHHRLELDLDPSITLKTDTTVLLGLIQAELMTNALKYGLGHRDEEVLSISLRTDGPGFVYELAHTGDRLPENFHPETSSGLGMILLSAYAVQLGSSLEWSRGDPTRFWLRFAE